MLDIDVAWEAVKKDFDALQFGRGIRKVMKVVDKTDHYFATMEPWTLKDQPEVLHKVLYICLEGCRVSAQLLHPIMPTSMDSVMDHLNVPQESRSLKYARYGSTVLMHMDI